MPERAWVVELYREHRRALFLTAWNVLRCPSLAEDAVHSAFVRLAELPAAPREPKLYAFRAVRNAALDLAKVRARRREEPFGSERLTEGIEQLPADCETGEEEMLTALTDALEQLDEAGREVIELHLHGGLTFREIATILDEPLPTVASRYRRSLEKLRGILEVSINTEVRHE